MGNTKNHSNSEYYPECWEFFVEQARNMEGEVEETISKYRVPYPDASGRFLYHDDVGVLFHLLRQEWYRPSLESPSVYGKIQYIVEKFNN